MHTNSVSRPGRALDPARRAAILAGARTVFMRDGFAQGTMDGVAAEAGVGKQTIYRHFRSKEALVEALVEAMCTPEVVAPSPSALPAVERLRQLLRALAEGLARADSVNLYRAIVAEAGRMPGLGRLFWDAGYRPLRTAIAGLLAEIADGDTASPTAEQVTAEQVVHLTLGDAYQELVLGTASPGPEIFERQIEAAIALLQPVRAKRVRR